MFAIALLVATLQLGAISIKYPPNIGQRCEKSVLGIGSNFGPGDRGGNTIVRIDRVMAAPQPGTHTTQTIGYIFTSADGHRYYGPKSAKQLTQNEKQASLDYLMSVTPRPRSTLQAIVEQATGDEVIAIGAPQRAHAGTKFTQRVCAAWPPDVPVHP
ncbi:MAG TPA: hypothetical protein VGR69_10000 [Candidatus Rubrimentiphilum sp.]|nr:hypothetical protein [Candidatus Rubrimentiphilum sp.]